MGHRPSVVVIAGPNGAGKTTVAPLLLQGVLGVTEFVNADAIGHGLSAFNAQSAAVAAGRLMLKRVKELADRNVSVAFETTLASRTFAPWLKELTAGGYSLNIVFLWLPNPEFAVARVADRVALGGHDVPQEVVRRRYARGIRNFFELYRPLTSMWRMYDTSREPPPRLIAAGRGSSVDQIDDADAWRRIEREIHGKS
jgi:predicted ABC-type ATPase